MTVLCPTPPHLLVDDDGRPYFLWDSDTTLAEFRDRVRTGDAAQRGYLVGKLLRQAKPDDVFTFVTVAEIRALGDAPRRDAGFSPLTFAWVLRGLPVEKMAEFEALSASETADLLEFRDGFVRRLADLTRPET